MMRLDRVRPILSATSTQPLPATTPFELMRIQRLLFVPVVLLMIGCGDPAPDADPISPPDTGATSEHQDHDAHAQQDAHDHAHEHAHDHDHGDSEPMPFQTIMRQLSSDMAVLTHALWIEDFPLMSEHAAAIAAHPPTDPADTQRIQEILGDEYEAFEEADHVVHEASDNLRRAVLDRDIDAILIHLDEVQRGCVACHSGFRDRLLTEGSTVPRR